MSKTVVDEKSVIYTIDETGHTLAQKRSKDHRRDTATREDKEEMTIIFPLVPVSRRHRVI